MKKKIIIFGGGPCGMRLAENLIDKGNEVYLYEKEKYLGGCWKINWDKGYFKEHSPRVMTTNYKNVINLIESLDLIEPFSEIYGSSFNSTSMFIKYFLKNLSFLDNAKFMLSVIFLSSKDTRTFKEWLDDNNITTKGRKALRNLSIALANVPERISAYTFFDSISIGLSRSKFIQFKEGDLWIKKWERRLVKKGVNIGFGTKLNSFHQKDKSVDYALTNKGRIYGDQFLLALPLWSLKDIMGNCKTSDLQNNWMPLEQFTYFCEKSSYTGLGVQLHFKRKTGIDLKKNWCSTCMGDWSIIAQKTSDYLVNFTKKHDIKEVWSCVIVDFTRKSKRLDKSPMKLTKEEIGEEVVYQLETTLGYKINPEKITYNIKELKNGKWDLIDSAYSSNVYGTLEPKGKKIKNLFSIGCHNIWKIAVLDGALESADQFTN